MAFDPQVEDYQRLGIRFAESLDNTDAAGAARAFASFGRRFAQDRDSLPQSDADRAFHLVAMASRLIDIELPFASDDRAQQIIDSGHAILDEAISLDEHCYDAIRMKAAATSPSFDDFLAFLDDKANDVRAYCEQQREELCAERPEERARLIADLAMRPYIRWAAAEAEEALICGRNKKALQIADEVLRADPADAADVRFTAALAHAKLEDEQGLDSLIERMRANGHARPANDAWMQLARMSLAFKRNDLETAAHVVERLVSTYPHAAEALIRQGELPDGVFARYPAAPYSEDELILALSEGTVLLQEGVDPAGRGVLSSWVAAEVAQRHPQALLAVMAQQSEEDEEGGGR